MTVGPAGARNRRSGWFQYPRELMAHLIETEGTEAHGIWCELVSMAAYKAESFETAYGIVELERGELLYSHRTFASRLRLKWTIVRNRIDRWAKNGRIRKRPLPRSQAAHTRAHPPTIITIVDFDIYSPLAALEHTPEDTQPGSDRVTEHTEEEGTREKDN
jgi:hypothetical protein